MASEFLRVLRGHRSRVQLSRRLRYRSNVAYLWESGRNWPTAAKTLWAASRVGVDVRAAIASFYRASPNFSPTATRPPPRASPPECIDLLAASGQIRRVGGLWEVARIQTVDTRADPGAGRRLKRWWAQVGIDAIEADRPGLFSFNIFSVSAADLARLEEMHRNDYRALRSVVAASEPPERVVVANVQVRARLAHSGVTGQNRCQQKLGILAR